MIKRSILMMFLFSMVGTSVNAQKVFTLEECLSYALKNNIAYKQTQLGTDFAKIDLEQSKYDRYPNLNGSLTQQINFGRSIDPTSYQFVQQATPITALGLNAGVDLFTGFRNKYTIERNEMALKDSEIQERIQENSMSLSVVSAYLDVLNAKEQIEVLTEQSEITLQQKERVQKLIKAGVLPKGDLLNLESQIANESVTLVNAENMVSLAQLNLAQVMNYDGLPDVVRPRLDPPSLAELDRMSVEAIYREALRRMPEMESVDLQEEIAKKNIAIAESGKYPNVSLFGGASTNFAGVKVPTSAVFAGVDTIGVVGLGDELFPVTNPRFEGTNEKVTPVFDQFSQNFNYNLGLNVSIPIFNRYQVKNNIARSELGVKTAQLQSQQMRNQLRQTIQQAYQAARMAAKTYEANLTTISSLEQSTENLKKRYELGASTALEYETAQNNLAVAKLNLNTAKFEYLFRLKILDFYQGKEITF